MSHDYAIPMAMQQHRGSQRVNGGKQSLPRPEGAPKHAPEPYCRDAPGRVIAKSDDKAA